MKFYSLHCFLAKEKVSQKTQFHSFEKPNHKKRPHNNQEFSGYN